MSSPSGIVLGIDLGTTFSTAAALVDGKLHFALDGRGEACIPSVVHFPKAGPPIVGAEADRLRASDPQYTVFGIKRIIGHAADSPGARLLDACAGFRIRAQGPQGAGEAAVEVRGRLWPASEVAALLLRHLRERAEARFGRQIGGAVLTVPVTATPEVKDAMRRCGRAAGLEVLRVVSEPCAGAVSRGFAGPGWGDAPVLVFDFGGGTFDATVVRKEDGRLKVLSSGGDDCLGGEDFDVAFARWIASGIWRTRNVEVERDVILRSRIQRQCEQVKRLLSSSPEARYVLKDAFSGREPHLDVLIHREHLRPHWAELVQRAVACAAATVRDAGLGPGDLGAMLLIGGTTFVPQVRAAAAAAFPRPCLAEDDPQTAVARGAALLGARPELLVD
ncbi:Hsp70 family protein [Anaeromyxobacter paludicola]|uniref:Uncharacterized protein n=1 Tax=Anaeromyxobacter paludicola TaxID=2918171 RepID=A0ABN6NCC6_9BACT|nr:Hsp70 family protein [Anaeromyxobacter paludicola]BDG10880.1 hypothetical protein AMPC_39930 [Anaeromyxobacter paludicola]